MESRSDLSAEDLAHRWQLVAVHRQHALKVARARIRNLADAEDIASEALTRAVRVDDLRPETVQGLISTIVMRLVIDHARREATRLEHEASRSGDGRVTSFEDNVTDIAEARWLARHLSKLNTREREVLLHRAAGHSNASTAAALDLSYKSVESAYTRARGHLQLVWKATLGVVLGTLVGARKLLGRSQPAFTATTMAVSAVALVVLIHEGPSVTPGLTFDTEDAVATRVSQGMTSTQSSTELPMRQVRPAGDEPSPSPSPSSHVILAPVVGDPDVAQAGVEITGDLFENPTNTVDRCYSKGYYIGEEGVGCTATLEADGAHPTADNGTIITFPHLPTQPKDAR